MRVMLVQYAGDYRKSYAEIQRSGAETYHAHAYVLEQLEKISESGDVAILCGLSGEAYRETLPNGIEVIGADAHPIKQFWKITRILAWWRPTHLVVQGPLTFLIRWGLRHSCRVLVIMAGSFEAPWWERLLKYQDLPRILRKRAVEWVTNHGINASKSLARSGVPESKIIPWDWPYQRDPAQLPAKTLTLVDGLVRLMYAGLVTADKGVDDMLQAMVTLKERGVSAHLDIAGSGDVDHFRAEAERLGIAGDVTFLGITPNAEVFDRMRAATAVIVSSRPAYPEGLPLTIYEALCSRTPVIASDHPMFAGHLVDGETALVYPAGDGVALAGKVEQLVGDAGLYERLSTDSAAAWQRMQNPTKWGDILRHWLADAPEDKAWLAARTLARVGTDTVAFRPADPGAGTPIS